MKKAISPLAALVIFASACVGTSGGEVVDFRAAASGPADATGEPLAFDTTRGWHVTLSTARLHIGALYLVDSSPPSGAQATSCVLPGSYVAQVLEGLDVDLLSGKPQLFPVHGQGVTFEALAGQIWLTGGDVDDTTAKPTVILRLSGNAERGGEQKPFVANLTIDKNRISDDANASVDSICKQRIVSRPLSLWVEHSGALRLRIDPRRLFTNVDFSALEAAGEGFAFRDDSSDQPSANLYNNLTQGGDLYSFTWVNALE